MIGTKLSTPEDKSKIDDFLRGVKISDITSDIKQNVQTFELNDQRYRMYLERSESDQSNCTHKKLVIVLGEFATGADPGTLLRAKLIQHIIAPEADLLLQINSTKRQPNLNFTRKERGLLWAGNSNPLTDRVMNAVDLLQPSDVIIFGPSQGGATALELASHKDLPHSNVTVIEPPNVKKRKVPELLHDFSTCGKGIKNELNDNFAEDTEIARFMKSGCSNPSIVEYSQRVLMPDNFALLGIIGLATAYSQIKTILDRGHNIMHIWANGDLVSPADINRKIATDYSPKGGYKWFEAQGDHSITSRYSLGVAGVKNCLLGLST